MPASRLGARRGGPVGNPWRAAKRWSTASAKPSQPLARTSRGRVGGGDTIGRSWAWPVMPIICASRGRLAALPDSARVGEACLTVKGGVCPTDRAPARDRDVRRLEASGRAPGQRDASSVSAERGVRGGDTPRDDGVTVRPGSNPGAVERGWRRVQLRTTRPHPEVGSPIFVPPATEVTRGGARDVRRWRHRRASTTLSGGSSHDRGTALESVWALCWHGSSAGPASPQGATVTVSMPTAHRTESSSWRVATPAGAPVEISLVSASVDTDMRTATAHGSNSEREAKGKRGRHGRFIP